MTKLKHTTALGVLLALALLPAAQADTITIGKGSGILWEGKPFNVTLSGPMYSATLSVQYGLLSISNTTNRCMSTLTTVAGYQALQIAPGIGLIPRATGVARYNTLVPARLETLSGTIGLPETKGDARAGSELIASVTSSPGYVWCLPPRMSNSDSFYDLNAIRTATITGNWVLVADGSQTSRQVAVSPMYAGSFAASAAGDRYVSILPSDIILRVSALQCTVATTTAINFGRVERNTTTGSELASLTYPMNVSCSQETDRINTNINVQFRPISGLYNGNERQLALVQGGGYITGEITNAVTGSGVCSLNTGIPFNNTQLRVGAISATDASKTFSNQVTWRLCSGGSSLPLGPVTASADMLVTFN